MSSTADLPPSYNEAIILGLQQPSISTISPTPSSVRPETNVSPQPVPLSSVDDYSFSWLYPVLVKVEETSECIKQELALIDNVYTPLGRRIRDVECKTYPALIVMSLTGIACNVEGDLLTYGMDPWKAWQIEGLFDNDQLSSQLPVNYSVMKHSLQDAMKPIRLWVQEELKLDRDFIDHEIEREPNMTAQEFLKLKGCMTEVHKVITSMHEWRHEHIDEVELGLADYATDLLVKIDMEYLWSYLIRMADKERAVFSAVTTDTVNIIQEAEERSAFATAIAPSTVEPSAPPDADYHSILSAMAEEENYDLPTAPPPPPLASSSRAPPPYSSSSSSGAQGSTRPSAPPLSYLTHYRRTSMYRMLTRLKNTIESISSEIDRIRGSHHLGEQIDKLTVRRVKAIKETALKVIMGEMYYLDRETQEPVFRCLDEGNLRQDFERLFKWSKSQQRLDEEWRSVTPRIPMLDPEEKFNLNQTILIVLNKVADTYGPYVVTRRTIRDYVAAMVIVEELENLWGLLTRVADAELN